MAIGIGLAGSGLLVFYYIGIMQLFAKQGLLQPGTTPLGGLSGGGITAMQTCAGVPFAQQVTGFKMVLSFCQIHHKDDPYCGGMLGELIRQSVLMNIKTYGRADAHQYCQDKLYVSLSVLDPLATTLLDPKSWTISNFTSIQGMVEIVGGTDFLSCFMAKTPYAVVRNTPVMDGGYTSDYAQFCPPKAERCIKLSAYSVGPNNSTKRLPACGAEAAAAASSRPVAGPWPQAQRDQWKLPSTCSYDNQTNAITGPKQPPFVSPSKPDIYPGNPLNYLPVDPCMWQSWSMSVHKVTPDVIQLMFDQGVFDATAWLAANPISAAG